MAMTRRSSNEIAIFYGGVRKVPGIPLYLQDSVSMNFSSNFGNLIDVPSNGMVDALADGFSTISKGLGFGDKFNVSAHNKYFGFQQWKGTDPVSFSLTVNLHMGIAGKYSGKLEVYDPIMELVSMSLPSETEAGILGAPSGQLMSLLVDQTSKALKIDDNSVKEAGSGRFVSLRIGEMAFLPKAILRRAEPSFATEFDSDGFPIQGTITLEFVSAFSATKKLLELWTNNVPYDGISREDLGGRKREVDTLLPARVSTRNQ